MTRMTRMRQLGVALCSFKNIFDAVLSDTSTVTQFVTLQIPFSACFRLSVRLEFFDAYSYIHLN